MDAELALVTANLALAGPGKLFYDPFMGTGGFLVSAAQFGAVVTGSDIDGRSFRGREGKKVKGVAASAKGVDTGIGTNMIKYGSRDKLLGCFISDLTNSPLRTVGPTRRYADNGQSVERSSGGWLDGIISDPPYGVREGLKVLGLRRQVTSRLNIPVFESGEPYPVHVIDGVPAHTLPGYIAPKRPYAFTSMLDDILSFAANTLVDEGRLAFWMPVYHAEDDPDNSEVIPNSSERDKGHQAMDIPSHRDMELISVCVQEFNKWSRRLLTYRRRRRNEQHKEGENQADDHELKDGSRHRGSGGKGKTANELNDFRRKYFQPANPKVLPR
ncbi:putative rna methylase family protein [Phaeomoniella chlamydospora]|uniref:Putative rna methylase family protein n=1 Tax=Phaeomoniella chlamydospora TaxID=158046 RepID=A0A0G2HLD2_PHACM|nr:putative rna methylase family protein [Phaeomoniella chlamydospora]